MTHPKEHKIRGRNGLFCLFHKCVRVFIMHYEKRTFSNKLRAIVAPMADTQAVTLWVLFGTGSKYEVKRINGISHFLEHLFFKGTKKRPKPADIFNALDRIGSQHNAFTSKEHTGYYVKASAKHFDISLDIVSDILLNPIFKAEEIEKERGVILQELSMYEDDPPRQVYQTFEGLLYGDQPAGWDTGGYPDTVKKITREDIIKYRHSHYTSSNAVVVVAGNIDVENTFSKIEKAFSKMPDGRKVEKLKVKELQNKPKVKFKKKDVDQTHVRIGVRGFNMFDERRYPMMVLQTILGGNSSSRLWMELREKLGLTYYVGASAEEYTDTGYLVTSAGVPHEKLPEVAKKIVQVLKEVKKNGVSQKDMDFAKEYLRGSMALAFESTDEVASFLAGQELFYKKVMTPEDILAKIEKVKRSDIIKVAREIFRAEKINMAAIGPHEDIKKYETILGEL